MKRALAKPLPGEIEVNKKLLDDTVQKVNRIHLERAMELHHELGAFLIETFFLDVKNVQAKAGSHVTFRAIAKHKDLKVSASTIWRSVAYVAQLKTFPCPAMKSLPPTTVAMIAGVKDEKKKLEIASKAVEENLNQKEVADLVRKTKNQDESRGRPTLPPVLKGMKQVESAIAIMGKGVISKVGLGEKILKELLDRAEKQTEALQAIVRELRKNL